MACTPDSCTSTHVTPAKSINSHQDRTRRGTRNPKAASGMRSSNGVTDKVAVSR